MSSERWSSGLLGLIIFLSSNLFSQTYEIKNFNSESGLPQDYIYALAQDSAGLLWIGTGAGLSSFDGKELSTYTIADGLAEDFIKAIFPDSEGRLWFGHYEGGISYKEKGKIHKLAKPKDNSSPVTCFTMDREGTVWAGTQADGLVMIKGARTTSFKNDSILAKIHSIAEISPGTFLIATEAGAYVYRFANQKLVLLSETPVLQTACKFIIKRSNSQYLLVSKDGFFLYDLNSQVVKIPHPSDFPLDIINSVFVDNTQSLFLGTQGKGIYKVSITNKTAEVVEHINIQNGLNNDYIKTVLIDREYNIWIGTYGGGLNKIEYPQFKTHEFFEDKSRINSVFQDRSGHFWIARKDALSRIDVNGKEEIMSLTTSIPQEIQDVTCLEETNKGEILLGTESGGVYLFNPVGKTYRQFFFQQNRPSANKIRDLHKDDRGNIWVATYEGVFLVDTTERIEQEITIADGLLHNVINTIYSDRMNNIWIVAEGPGISRYDDGKIKTFKFRGQINFNLNCITEDSTGRLWLGTDGGGVFSFSKGKFRKVINKEEGLISNYCNAIVCDKNDNLWVVHSDGLTKFTPSLREVIQYQKINGLSVKSIRSNSIVRSRNNNIYWGAEGKLVEYNTDLDALAVISPILNIKGVELFFEKVDWTQLADAVYGNFNLPSQLVLNHNQNHLNFRFEAISFRAENILYRFKLQGFDQKWSLSTAQDFATYANLPPGEYTFMVSALSAGIWTKYQSFSFRISSPFWKTWWFIFLTIVVLTTIVGGIVYLRISNLKRKHNFLEEQKKVLMAEIRERKIAESKMIESEKKLMVVNEKLVKTNQELSTFIYRSSHDLKGPLMSIMGLTNLGKMETKEQNTAEYFSKIAHSATRLDGILKVLSTVTEIKEWKVDIQPIDFNQLAGEIMKELKVSYNVALIERNIQVNGEFFSDPILITIIIRALLDNSFKYMNPHQKTPSIALNILSFKEGIKINVQDNGIGICQEVIERVFDMFFKGTERSSGFGLGLYVVSNCVEKLNGSHSISSTEFQGTSVSVYLPDQRINLSRSLKSSVS